jgi:hypothetical protein
MTGPLRVTRDSFENRLQQRVVDQMMQTVYQQKIRAEATDKAHQETDARALLRQKRSRQRIADQEFEFAERIYREQHEQETRSREKAEQDAIASALHDNIQAETRDQKTRAILRENDPDYRALKGKLQLALVTQTRDNQRRDKVMRDQIAEQERVECEIQMMRKYRLDEAARTAEEQAKHEEHMLGGLLVREQIREKERRRKLLEAAQAERDKGQVDAVVRRVQAEDEAAIRAWREQKDREREQMYAFMDARARMKEEERKKAEDEDAQIRAFNAAIDDRLNRAIDEQKRREAQRMNILQRIALEIKRKREEEEGYENLCLELAKQQELQKLADREAAEARKLAEHHAECKRFMDECHRAKAARIARDKEDEEAFQRQVVEENRRLEELALIEQEKNQLRIAEFKRELNRQITQKKVMYETARQEELRKLQLEQEREAERKRILEEERRKLVLGHILSQGPEAVKYLPKGVLMEDDLNYLPEDYREAILNQSLKQTF